MEAEQVEISGGQGRDAVDRKQSSGRATKKTNDEDRARALQRMAEACAFLSGPGGSWINAIEDAPCFSPSEAEWADPIAYIRSIQGACKGAGICRIIPPLLPAVPGPAAIAERQGRAWRYGAREQYLGGGAWRTFDDARAVIYESHRTYTLQEHEARAAQFARRVFGSAAPMPPRMVEAEYWRQRLQPAASNGACAAGVLYGNDVEGTAFSARSDDALAAGQWNLGALPRAPGSTLGLLPGLAVPGVTTPMLYIGMLGATFCFHVEDHWLYSINYHHWGAPKVWYGVPASHAGAFEEAAEATVYAAATAAARAGGAPPEAVRARVLESLLMKSTMVSPGALLSRGVRVVRAVQQPGEFVVTLPRAYHGGLSCGFNCGEAVNFATPDWLPFGLQCAARLRRLGAGHILPTEQLLCAEAAAAAAARGLMGSGGDGGGAAEAGGMAKSKGQAAAGGSGAAGGGGGELALRCFLRHMRAQHARRRALAAAGAAAAWLPESAPAALPCASCREPAHLAVLVSRRDGRCVCLRCGAGAGGGGGGGGGGADSGTDGRRGGAALLLRRSLPEFEALARRLEGALGGPAAGDPWAAAVVDPRDCGPLGPGGLDETSAYGSDETGALLGPAEAAAAAMAASMAGPFRWHEEAGWPAEREAAAWVAALWAGGGGEVGGGRAMAAAAAAAAGRCGPPPKAKAGAVAAAAGEEGEAGAGAAPEPRPRARDGLRPLHRRAVDARAGADRGRKRRAEKERDSGGGGGGGAPRGAVAAAQGALSAALPAGPSGGSSGGDGSSGDDEAPLVLSVFGAALRPAAPAAALAAAPAAAPAPAVAPPASPAAAPPAAPPAEGAALAAPQEAAAGVGALLAAPKPAAPESSAAAAAVAAPAAAAEAPVAEAAPPAVAAAAEAPAPAAALPAAATEPAASGPPAPPQPVPPARAEPPRSESGATASSGGSDGTAAAAVGAGAAWCGAGAGARAGAALAGEWGARSPSQEASAAHSDPETEVRTPAPAPACPDPATAPGLRPPGEPAAKRPRAEAPGA